MCAESLQMHTGSKTGGQIQGLPLFDWRAAVVRKPRRAPASIRRLPMPPGHDGLIAALAGLGSAVDR